MPTFIECPTCSRRLRMPDDLQVLDVQCPSCGTTFPTAAETSRATAIQPPLELERIEPAAAWRVCPFCREDIARDATRCRYCGEAVDGEEGALNSGKVRRDSEPHRGKILLTFGIVSLVLSGLYGLAVLAIPLGLTIWVLGRRDLRLMRTGEMDPQGAILTGAGNTCGMIGVVLGCVWLAAFTIVFLIGMAI